MYAVPFSNTKSVGDEVVLHSRINLYDIPSLSSHIQILDTAALIFSSDDVACPEVHDMCPVLERSAKLCSIDSQSKWLVTRGPDVYVGVLLNRRPLAGRAGREE